MPTLLERFAEDIVGHLCYLHSHWITTLLYAIAQYCQALTCPLCCSPGLPPPSWPLAAPLAASGSPAAARLSSAGSPPAPLAPLGSDRLGLMDKGRVGTDFIKLYISTICKETQVLHNVYILL